MRRILMLLSWCGLGLIILPPVLYLFSAMSAETMRNLLLGGTFLWFASRIPLSGKERQKISKTS